MVGLVLITEPAHAVTSFIEVKQQFATSDAVLLDRHGAIIDQLRVDLKERKLPWVNLEDISPALRNALIASEDKRFYQHSGVDWSAVSASAWGNFWNTKTRGASTITMQLAGLLEDDLKRRSGGRSLSQKISQAYIAQRLEQGWRKDQILETYLNLVPFRGELIGVHALSRVIFNKHPSGLDQVEAAIAVALIRAPNATALKVSERACRILKDQQRSEFCANLEGQTVLAFSHLNTKATPLIESNSGGSTVHLAPHFARKLLNAENRAVTSTIDGKLQSFAKDSLVRQLSALVDRNVEDGAIIVLDNASGDILAWVGSSGNLSDAAQVDGVSALRQAGSTLKPFLYELALEKKLITAASLLDDTPVNISTSGGLYVPQNYDKHFKGLISARTALASSLNIPAVRILVGVSDDVFFQRLQNLGFQLRETGGYYGYSLALGSADVSLLNLSNAYRSLANAGRYSPPRFRLNDALPKSLSVMDPGASYIVNDVLSDRAARSVTFGLENALSTRMWSAVKTGTSKDMRDNWCIGFSDRYTVGVWVGNASGAPMWDVSGVTGAAPVWQEIMHYLQSRDRFAQKLPKRALPPNVVASKIHYRDGVEPGRTELFLRGTEQTEIYSAQSDQILQAIVYPKAGMIVALDPDIPFARQRMRLNASGVQARTVLVLDGHVVPVQMTKKSNGVSELSYEWFPWPGKHALSLVNQQGELLDQVRFEVRGAVEKKGQP
ncbi:penicillin-binding protein 1C [Undibacterium sp. SXout11W]|uniref:penicillin-binding protein 1C n=1 Tax=Undibacterium sp. SXout11W TaxID=3413050 RepID=UPI003BF0E398